MTHLTAMRLFKDGCWPGVNLYGFESGKGGKNSPGMWEDIHKGAGNKDRVKFKEFGQKQCYFFSPSSRNKKRNIFRCHTIDSALILLPRNSSE